MHEGVNPPTGRFEGLEGLAGKIGEVLEGLEQGLGERVVVAHRWLAEGRHDSETLERGEHGRALHGGPIVGIDLRWEGTGVDEKGYDTTTGHCIVAVDPRYFRPTEVETLLGDPTKAREKLGWVPEITFADVVREMMREDLKEAERDALCRREGYRTLARIE